MSEPAGRRPRLGRVPAPVRYRSAEEDSGRWSDFPFRPGDIVISTRSKSGTTWMQMICALLVFQTPELPAPLSQLSPWLDWLVVPQRQVYAELAAQRHRRFIKTHTPLDGVPIEPQVSYIVVARHPLDMAVSLYHQGDNIDRERLRQLTGAPPSDTPTAQRLPLGSPFAMSWLWPCGQVLRAAARFRDTIKRSHLRFANSLKPSRRPCGSPTSG